MKQSKTFQFYCLVAWADLLDIIYTSLSKKGDDKSLQNKVPPHAALITQEYPLPKDWVQRG